MDSTRELEAPPPGEYSVELPATQFAPTHHNPTTGLPAYRRVYDPKRLSVAAQPVNLNPN